MHIEGINGSITSLEESSEIRNKTYRQDDKRLFVFIRLTRWR